jgi:hypothetical protein
MPWPKGTPLPAALKRRISRSKRGVALPPTTREQMAVVAEASASTLHKTEPTPTQRVVIVRRKRPA